MEAAINAMEQEPEPAKDNVVPIGRHALLAYSEWYDRSSGKVVHLPYRNPFPPLPDTFIDGLETTNVIQFPDRPGDDIPPIAA